MFSPISGDNLMLQSSACPNGVMVLAALELLKEADVVFGEETKVLDAVFEVRDTLYTHSEGITAIFLAVNAAGLQHIRVHHATTEDFHPSCTFAERATGSAADITTDIHLGTRFREREIGRTQTNLRIRTEHLLTEI